MSTSIATVDLSSAAEALRDKIRLAFVELIPNEKWNELVQAEIQRFFAERVTPLAYGETRTEPSPFAALVRAEMQRHVQDLVRERLCSPEFSSHWTGNGTSVSQAVKAYMEANHAIIVKAAIGHVLEQGIQHVLDSAGMRR